jgi:putative phage-type endonuclease
MLNNQDFTRERTKYLGGSDVGAILGLSKYRSAVDVWMEKTGKFTAQKDALPLRFGQFAEEFVAQEYALATGCKLAIYEAPIPHPHYAYIQGHIDRFVLEKDTPLIGDVGAIQALRILECKTANPFAQSEWGEVGTDQIPLSYLVQCVWYMMITKIERTDLAVLFGNADFRIYEVRRDQELEQMVLERAINFWENHVLKDLPPPASSESDYKSLFPQSSPAKSIEATSETLELIKKLNEMSQQIELLDTEISNIKQRIMAQMQDAEVLTLQGKTIATWKAPKPSVRLDTKRLSEEHPNLVPQYQVPIQNSRRLVIKNV